MNSLALGGQGAVVCSLCPTPTTLWQYCKHAARYEKSLQYIRTDTQVSDALPRGQSPATSITFDSVHDTPKIVCVQG